VGATWLRHSLCQRTQFGDIFYDSAFKNGLLPVILPAEVVGDLARAVGDAADPTMTVDLEHCMARARGGLDAPFALDHGRRWSLLDGIDDIGRTLTHCAAIDAFQAADRQRRPWIHQPPENRS